MTITDINPIKTELRQVAFDTFDLESMDIASDLIADVGVLLAVIGSTEDPLEIKSLSRIGQFVIDMEVEVIRSYLEKSTGAEPISHEQTALKK